MATYTETLSKLQEQTLEALKQAQATQVAALTTIGELVSTVPTFRPAAGLDALPTFTELVDLNAAFTRNVLEQQAAYAAQLASIFTATQKTVAGTIDAAVAQTTSK